MPTPAKQKEIDSLAHSLDRAKLAVLTDYRGLKVSDLQSFRSTLRPMNAECRVAKNTLTRIAAERVGIAGLEPMLDGPLAIVLAYDDIVAPAKAVADFVRTSRVLTVKTGVLDGRLIAAGDVEELGNLPSREVLLGTLLGLMNSPLQRTVTVLNGPSRSFAYLVNARAEQLEATAGAAD